MIRGNVLFEVEKIEQLALINRLTTHHDLRPSLKGSDDGIMIRQYPRGLFQQHRPTTDKCSRYAAVLRNLRRLVRERIVRRGLRRPRHLIRRPFRLSELRNAIRRKFVTPMVIAVGSKSVGEIIGLPASQLELRRDG